MSNSALIFIPDISGYTKFVTQTEIRHSNHIISELIETIIKANILKLTVSEIEGDAVLFYRKESPPKIEELIEQVKRMFIDFHTHIKIIQRDNVCQCGACRTAVNLSLKFITHFGELRETIIQNFTKIIGSDVILAHRLLKNTIPGDEYLLLTGNYLMTQDSRNAELDPWIEFKEHTENYESFENVNLKYTSLIGLNGEIPSISEIKKPDIKITKPSAEIFIDAPILLVHEILTNHEEKINFVPGIKDLKSDSPINRVNASHTCVFEDLEIHFVTQVNDTSSDGIRYVEEGEASLGFGFISDYMLKEEGTGTKLSVRSFPKVVKDENASLKKKVLGRIKTGLMLMKLKSISGKNLAILKSYCEKVTFERGLKQEKS